MRRTGSAAFAQIGNTVAAQAVMYSDTTVVAGTAYDYKIVSTNVNGDGAASNTVSATAQATAPGAATGLIATVSGTAVMLSWAAPTGTAPTGYKVMRRTGSAAFAQIGNTVAAPAVTYSDATAVAGTAYDYQIVSTNAQGDGAASNTASATVPAVTTVPGAPTNVAASLFGSLVALAWGAPATGSAPTGYKVMRSTSSGSGFAEIHNSSNLFFNDASVAASTLYYYKVLAYNASGDGTASNEVSITSAA